jgi:excisionase family DNA binding protein
MKTKRTRREPQVAGRDLTTSEAAALADLSATFVRKACDRGELVCYRHPGSGGFRRIRPADLRAWLLANCVPTRRLDAVYPHVGLPAVSECDEAA